jgi:hypothetical protein
MSSSSDDTSKNKNEKNNPFEDTRKYQVIDNDSDDIKNEEFESISKAQDPFLLKKEPYFEEEKKLRVSIKNMNLSVSERLEKARLEKENSAPETTRSEIEETYKNSIQGEAPPTPTEQSTPVVLSYLGAVSGHIDKFASQVKNGDFSENGTGRTGLIYNYILKEPDQSMPEIWDNIIDVSFSLWQNGNIEEAVQVLEKSLNDFYIPAEKESMIRSTLQNFKKFNTSHVRNKTTPLGAGDELENPETHVVIEKQQDANTVLGDPEAPVTVEENAQDANTALDDPEAPVTVEENAQDANAALGDPGAPVTVEENAQDANAALGHPEAPVTVEENAQDANAALGHPEAPVTVEENAQDVNAALGDAEIPTTMETDTQDAGTDLGDPETPVVVEIETQEAYNASVKPETPVVIENHTTQTEIKENSQANDELDKYQYKKEISPPKRKEKSESVILLREAQNNLENFANQIRDNEYALSGAGQAGLIFRSISDETEEALESVWSEIIATCSSLWIAEFQDEAVMMMEVSEKNFFIPEVWKEQVKNSLEHSSNYSKVKKVEIALEQGADNEALLISKTIEGGDDEQQYVSSVAKRITKRKASRKIAFIIAGFTIVSLLIISIIGITTAERLYQTPPTPSFEVLGDSLENLSESLRDQRTERDNLEGANSTVTPQDILGTEPTQQSVLGNIVPDIQQETEITIPETTPDTQTNELQNSDTNIETQNNQDALIQTPQNGGFAPLQEQTPQTTETSQDVNSLETEIQDCILGYAVLAEGQRMMSQGFGDNQADLIASNRLQEFESTLAQACTKLNINPVKIASDIPLLDTIQVRTITENILFQEISPLD